MMETHPRLPLTELLRPRALQELTLPEGTVRRLEDMLTAADPTSMLFFGPPGMGKTSAACIFMEAPWQPLTLSVDGSKDNGVDFMRTRIQGFSRSPFFGERLRICFIDDGDYLSPPAQAAFRGIIDRSATTCRFIVAVNDVSRIDNAVRSRLLPINFAITKADAQRVLEPTQERIARRLTELGWSFNRQRLNIIVSDYLWDFRRMAKKIEFELGGKHNCSI
jgi:replication factor C small subunit